jgi:hypothetical protein
VYTRLGLVLFALEVSSPKTGRVRVAINPSGFIIPPVGDYRVHGYVIAENSADAMRVTRVRVGNTRSSVGTIDVSCVLCSALICVVPCHCSVENSSYFLSMTYWFLLRLTIAITGTVDVAATHAASAFEDC